MIKCFVVEFVLQVLHGVLTAQGEQAAGWFFETSHPRYIELYITSSENRPGTFKRQ